MIALREKETKMPEENDPIKKMLERLRRSVTDLPAEGEEASSRNADTSSADISDPLQPLKEKAVEGTEDDLAEDTFFDMEEVQETAESSLDNIGQNERDEDDAAEETADEDAVDDDVIAQFFDIIGASDEPPAVVPASGERAPSGSSEEDFSGGEELFLLSLEEDGNALSEMARLDGEEEVDPFLALAEELSAEEQVTASSVKKVKKEPTPLEDIMSVDAFAAAFPSTAEQEADDAPAVSYVTSKTEPSVRGEALQKSLQESIIRSI